MKQLILLRHAEAQSQRPGLADFDRSLTDQGRTEALDAADCLRRASVRIDALISSPAQRAKETALIVAAQLDFNRSLRYERLLYGEEVQKLLQPLRQCEPEAATVLMVGHNPGLSSLASHLGQNLTVTREALGSGTDGDSPIRRLNGAPIELTTAGICRIEFEAESWSALAPQTVQALALIR